MSRLAARGYLGGGEGADRVFVPDDCLPDSARVDGDGWSLGVLHTPGHFGNHICLSWGRAMFTGDHVMGWSTTVVSPPDGDMAAYIESLRRVAGREDATLWPTHGPPRDDGRVFVEALVEHRLERERGVLAAVRDGRSSIPEIVQLLYADVREELHKPAGRSVWAHLTKLVADGQVCVEGDGAPSLDAVYRAG